MLLPLALQAIVNEIDACDDGELAPSSLARALRQPLSIDDVAPFLRFDPHNYVRNLVAKTDRWELRLLCWKPRQRTSIHAHGDAACVFRVVRGTAHETVLGERDRTWTPGAVVEEPLSLVHQVGNTMDDALITLHAYSPSLPVDAPSSPNGRQIVILGGGFAGICLAYHLLRRGGPDLRITIVERGPWIGRGVAYGVESPAFSLNVPASRMSLDPENSSDFVEWARAQDRPDAFLSRSLYGAYVVERFAGAVRHSRSKARIVRGDAVAIDGRTVSLSSGETFDADVIVVATGLAPRILPNTFPPDARIVDAWDECGLATMPTSGRVLVMGAGLSALDVATIFYRRGFAGELVVVSRNGLLPRPHLEPFSPAKPLPAADAQEAPKSLLPLVRWVRALVRQREREGAPWQHGIDALRPHVASLWSSLPPHDRARFVRSIRPYWEVLRHRAPVDALRIVEELRAASRFRQIAGTVAKCERRGETLEVELRLRGGQKRVERFDAIVRCLGPSLDHLEAETPLLRSLIQGSRAMRDPAGLGIVTTSDGAIVGADGVPSSSLFALGAPRRASMWESTSVPDIAVHARALAERIAQP